MTEALVQALDARLRVVDRVVGNRIVRWIDDSDLSLHEARVLLTLAEHDRPMAPAEIGERCGLDIDAVYHAVHSLRRRGITNEDQRRHQLTDSGRELMERFSDARREGVEAFVAQLPDDERRRLETALQVKS
jgi:DNA-binding MarR family transcriptional regulator